VVGAVSGAYQYDAIGRRRSKQVGGATTRFLYDGFNFVQELTDGSPPATTLTGLSVDETFARTDAAGTRALLPGALGSIVALADEAGTVQTQYTFDPFGNTMTSGTPSTNAAQFTGRENDANGLYFYRARYYAPGIMRFLSEDPLGFGGGDVNLHAYVGGNPTRSTDPLGLYNRDVHYDLTNGIGVQVGFCAGDAARIAAADQDVDDNPWTSPMPIMNFRARAWYHFPTRDQLENLRRSAFDTGSLLSMGMYLHAFQDSYSHQRGRKDRNGEPYGWFLGHAYRLTAPDEPRNRPVLWRRMVDATTQELLRFHQRFPACQGA